MEPARNGKYALDDVTKADITEDLYKAWHFHREENCRRDQREIWKTTDHARIVLSDTLGSVNSKAKLLCNKLTAFYYTQSVQYGRPDCPEPTQTPGIVFAALYEEWRRCDSDGNIEFGHFLANPVRITKSGPDNLQGIVKAHASLCAQATALTLDLEQYSMHPLYPGIVIVCDRNDLKGNIECHSDGFVSLRKVAEKQTVLVVLTGVNAGLPISLEKLIPHALPIRRMDVFGLDAVRVPLDIAAKFFIELKTQFQHLGGHNPHVIDQRMCPSATPKGYDRSVCYNPDTWVRAMQAAAEEHGYDSMWDTRESLRRVRAHQAGQVTLYEFEHDLFANRWRP